MVLVEGLLSQQEIQEFEARRKDLIDQNLGSVAAFSAALGLGLDASQEVISAVSRVMEDIAYDDLSSIGEGFSDLTALIKPDTDLEEVDAPKAEDVEVEVTPEDKIVDEAEKPGIETARRRTSLAGFREMVGIDDSSTDERLGLVARAVVALHDQIKEPKYRKVDWETIVKKYLGGLNAKTIAIETGIKSSDTYVYSILRSIQGVLDQMGSSDDIKQAIESQIARFSQESNKSDTVRPPRIIKVPKPSDLVQYKGGIIENEGELRTAPSKGAEESEDTKLEAEVIGGISELLGLDSGQQTALTNVLSTSKPDSSRKDAEVTKQEREVIDKLYQAYIDSINGKFDAFVSLNNNVDAQQRAILTQVFGRYFKNGTEEVEQKLPLRVWEIVRAFSNKEMQEKTAARAVSAFESLLVYIRDSQKK